jgi:hypothetical protein
VKAEALFSRSNEEAGEKRFFDEGEGGGKAMRMVEPADFGLDTGWFAEGREKLVGNE